MRLHIMRHGQTDWNLAWRMQGVTDIELNETGLMQAEEAAERLKDQSFDAVFSSPLKRAYVTAKIIADTKGLEVQVNSDLIEMCFGPIEGTTPEYKLENPNRELFFTAPEKYVPSGEGETFEQVDKRARDFLEFIKSKDYEDVLIVTHGAYIRALYRVLYDLPLEKFWDSGVMHNCDTAIIEV